MIYFLLKFEEKKLKLLSVYKAEVLSVVMLELFLLRRFRSCWYISGVIIWLFWFLCWIWFWVKLDFWFVWVEGGFYIFWFIILRSGCVYCSYMIILFFCWIVSAKRLGFAFFNSGCNLKYLFTVCYIIL